jgi:hypothetical protein
MKLTNDLGLPEPLVEAVRNDPYYSAGDISVTRLINPPQITSLLAKHRDELVEDASERIWSLDGQSVHAILERAQTKRTVIEHRMYIKRLDWIIGGQLDVLDLESGTLWDYKKTSVWSVVDGVKKEWEQQLNLLRVLVEETTPWLVKELRICAILRDWSPTKAGFDKGYPQRPVTVVRPKLWSISEAREFLYDRVEAHQWAMAGDVAPCTDEERWISGGSWAVMKSGRKKALRLLETEEEARMWAINNDYRLADDEITIVRREVSFKRCEAYCPVRTVCTQPREPLTNEGNRNGISLTTTASHT